MIESRGLNLVHWAGSGFDKKIALVVRIYHYSSTNFLTPDQNSKHSRAIRKQYEKIKKRNTNINTNLYEIKKLHIDLGIEETEEVEQVEAPVVQEDEGLAPELSVKDSLDNDSSEEGVQAEGSDMAIEA